MEKRKTFSSNAYRSIFNFFILSIYFEFWEFRREKIRFTRAWSHRLTFPLSETQKNRGGGERGQLNVTYRSLNETNGARWLCCMHKWRGSPATRLLSSGYFWNPRRRGWWTVMSNVIASTATIFLCLECAFRVTV